MSYNFDTIIDMVINFEGGYSNDPNDPGGETNFGISKRAHPDLDIKEMTREQAKFIYDQNYGHTGAWDAYNWSPDAITPAFLILDTAVLFGTWNQTRMMQQALGDVAVDGSYGPITKARLAEVLSNSCHREIFIIRLLKIRAERHLTSSNYKHFGRGWLNRLFKILDEEYA